MLTYKFTVVNSMNSFKLIVMMIISMLMLSALTIQTGEGQTGEREFRQTHINLKAGDGLSPETEHDNETEAQRELVIAQYDDFGVGRTNRQWVDVGTWMSDGIENALTLDSGQYRFNMWFQVVDSTYTADPDWEFTLRRNGVDVTSVQVLNTAESNTQPIEIWANSNVGSPEEAEAGDTFEIYIRYRAWEDCYIYYDNVTYDSGGVGSMDSVIILQADTSSAKFHDAWGINWESQGKYFCQLNYGGEVNVGNFETVISEGGTVETENGTAYPTTKIKFNNIIKGNGSDVMITINYGDVNASEGWTVEAGSNGGGNGGNGNDDDDDFPVEMVGGGVIVFVLVIVLVYLFVFKKRGAEEEGDEEYEEYEDEGGEEEEEEEE